MAVRRKGVVARRVMRGFDGNIADSSFLGELVSEIRADPVGSCLE